MNRDEETGEEVKKLGEMKSEVLVMTLGKLLTKIDPSYTLSRLPSNMAGKFRVASDLIEKIRVGFKHAVSIPFLCQIYFKYHFFSELFMHSTI